MRTGADRGRITCVTEGSTVGRFTIDPNPPGTGPCVVTAIDDDGVEVQSLTLQCNDGSFTLAIHTADPHVAVPVIVEDAVTFEFTPWEDICSGVTGLAALRNLDGDLLFGGINAPDQALENMFPGWTPVQVSILATGCPGTEEFCDFRGTLVEQRAGLKFTADGGEAVVFSGNSGMVGADIAYTINVSTAERTVCLAQDCANRCYHSRVEAVWVAVL